MKKKLLLIITMFSCIFMYSQSIYNNDTIVCDSYQGDLVAVSATGDDISGDDDYSGIIPIGFPFTFYGNIYNSLLISDNGYVTFDLTNALGYSPYGIYTPIPNPGNEPENAIMTPWQDLYLPAGGKCFYALEGISPNRRFLISWCNVSMYSCNTSFSTLQIVLHEGSNKIETFIESKPSCSWNSGTAVHGLVSANSTFFNIVTDPVLLQPRNYPLEWTAFNEGWEFIANGATSYTINQIPFVPVTAAPVDWFNANGDFLESGPIYTVNITTSTTFYTSLSGECFGTSNTDSITITIISPNVDLGPNIFITCNSDTVLNPILLGGISPYTYNWNTGSLDSIITVNGGTYNVIISDSIGCTDSAQIIVTENPPPSFNLGADTIIACNSSYLLTPNVLGGTAPYAYQWLDSNSVVISTNSSTTVGEGNYDLIVSDLFGCGDTSSISITYAPPPTIDFDFDGLPFDNVIDIDIIPCGSTSSYGPVSIQGGTPPYSYSWSNILLSVIDSSDTVFLGDGLYYLIVTDDFGCSGSDTLEIIYDSPPVVDLGSDDTIACNTTTILTPNIIGGTQPYTYVWSNGSINSSIAIAEGNYTVTVSGLYGCFGSDVVEISEDDPGTVTLSGGGPICANGTFAEMNFNFDGLLPWDLVFANGLINQTVQAITDSNYLFETNNDGIYNVVSASDFNDCLANIVGTAQVIVHPLPVAIISPSEISIYEDDSIELEVGEYAMYHWFSTDGLDLDTFSTLTVSDSGIFYVEVIDFNGCSDISDNAIVNTKPYTELFIPNTFTPNGDDHNELFVISGVNIKAFNIQIFNRWGELMFMSESIYKSWDGTFANNKVQEGLYYYQIEVEGNDGKIFKKGGVIKAIY